MTAYVALLRAVNVAGATLPMGELKAIGEAAGFAKVRTYIASGNLLFESPHGEAQVKAELEQRLAAFFGKPTPVMVRTAAELAAVMAANPFPDAAGARLLVMFLDSPPVADAAERAVGKADDELIAPGVRELYICYGAAGIGRSKLRIPAAAGGTGRNLNTVAKLATLATAL